MARLTADSADRIRLRTFLNLYALFLVFASLHPLSGWSGLAGWSLDFLAAPWPRYITRTDLATNLLAYAPLGYALALWLSAPGRRLGGIVLASAAGLLLSLALESLQQLLPGRIASNLDILVNGLGALVGALLTLHHGRWLRAGTTLRHWRGRWFLAGAGTNLGLLLLVIWFVAQFALVPIPGIGWLHLHLRPFDHPGATLAAMNLPWLLAQFAEFAAVGAFTACLLRPGRYTAGLAMLFVAAFFTKLLAATILLKLTVAGGVFSLESLGALLLALWLLLIPALSRHRRTTALAGVAVVLLIRLLLAKQFLSGASLLNITGLAQHLGALWPVLALLWLLAPQLWPSPHAERRRRS